MKQRVRGEQHGEYAKDNYTVFRELGLYYRTIKHLKPIQIRYRLWYMLRHKVRRLIGHSYPNSIPKEGNTLELITGLTKPSTFNVKPASQFTFLNQSHTFEEAIDWNFGQYGKLWAYNLNYFDYLHQQDLSKEVGLKLIYDFIDQLENNSEGMEPYPISLRGINWIKFLSNHNIKDSKVDASLYAQYQVLLDNIEYHILGNHLLENGCSLLFGAYYFQDEELYESAKKILNEQCKEQILEDGGHFERSTMYHCILLERLMDCYNLVKNNSYLDDTDLEKKLKRNTELMLGWMEQLIVGSKKEVVIYDQSAVSEELPLLNDAAKDVGPNPSELLDYATRLGLESKQIELEDSGYRKYDAGCFELICDVGEIGPDYIPGHAHSDTLSFVLYCDGNPVIIDPGISTYENNERRQLERSTKLHNTVQFDNKDQSEIWSAFRVGRRAKVPNSVEQQNNGKIKLSASHNGYRKWGVMHERKWIIEQKSNYIRIKDTVTTQGNKQLKSYLHFDPRWNDKIKLNDKTLHLGKVVISFETNYPIKCYNYDCPDGYNQYVKATKVEIPFASQLITNIRCK